MSKRILVHGSIAIDYIMDFEGNLYNNAVINNEKQEFSLAVMPTTKKMQYGGTAGNISYSIGLLGIPCEVVTSVGQDFKSTFYRDKFKNFPNIKLNLHEYADGFCANCYIVNDSKKQQLIIYHGGVTQKIPEKSLKDLGINTDTISWAINSPENPLQMIRVAKELKSLGIKCVLDTGQVTPAFSGDQLLDMIKNSELMICNENEFSMILNKTGLNRESILDKIKTVIVTKGGKGSTIISKNGNINIPIVKPDKIIDPTGAGDGYRAGLLCALHQGLSLEEGCKIGATVGSFVVEVIGGQMHIFSRETFKQRYETTFGAFPLKI